MYGFWDMVQKNSPKNQNFEKMEKNLWDITILHMCTENYDQMMYGSWDMLHNGWRDGQMDGQTDRKSDI